MDILSSVGEMPFDRVWRNRVDTAAEGLSIPFISKAALIEEKRQVKRPRDLADAKELARISGSGELCPKRMAAKGRLERSRREKV